MSHRVCGVKMLLDFSQFVIVRLRKKNKLQMLHKMKSSSALKTLQESLIRRFTGRVLFNPGLASMLLKAAFKHESWGE